VASPRVLQPSDRLGWLGDRLRLCVDSVLVQASPEGEEEKGRLIFLGNLRIVML
jgi:hypothetical protein